MLPSSLTGLSTIVPDVENLATWLNPRYIEAHRRGELQYLFVKTEPFERAVFADFLRPWVISAIEDYCGNIQLERARTDGIARHADWYWGPFGLAPVVRFFFSRSFRRFLNDAIGADLTMRASRIPQFNVFRPGSRGLPIHNDAVSDPVGVVSLLQLSKGYEPGLGGELCFFRREAGKWECLEQVAPIRNTFILFKVSAISFHSVVDMHGDWTRENIAFDWYQRKSCSLA